MDIAFHVFYIIVAGFSLWSSWIWKTYTFPAFVGLKAFPFLIFLAAVFFELFHAGFLIKI